MGMGKEVFREVPSTQPGFPAFQSSAEAEKPIGARWAAGRVFELPSGCGCDWMVTGMAFPTTHWSLLAEATLHGDSRAAGWTPGLRNGSIAISRILPMHSL